MNGGGMGRRDNRHVTEQPLPSWPTTPRSFDSVVLREFTDQDAHLAVELRADPYIPLIGSLPAFPTAGQALEWIGRQRGRLAEGTGLSFAIAEAQSDNALGTIGLWLRNLSAGRATAGYSVSPAHRGRGVASGALQVLTTFAWTIPVLHRVELFIEPWNTSSLHVAEAAGYQGGTAPQPPGDRRHPARHAALRDDTTMTAAQSGKRVRRELPR